MKKKISVVMALVSVLVVSKSFTNEELKAKLACEKYNDLLDKITRKSLF